MSIKELRERTGAGLMDCRRALNECDNDIDKAVALLREKGVIKAAKRGGRVAAEGVVMVATHGEHEAAMVEVNSETDFVSKGEAFQSFAQEVTALALSEKTQTIEALLSAKLASGQTIEEKRQEMVLQIGENIQVRRVHYVQGDAFVTQYMHGKKIAVLVMLSGQNEAVGRDIAMHVAATNPASITEQDLDPALIEAERQIYLAQAAESGKPEAIQAKMVEGKVQRFIKERSLVHQPFVKNPDQTVQQYLAAEGGLSVHAFVRFELGENQEVVKENFADEVSKMLKD